MKHTTLLIASLCVFWMCDVVAPDDNPDDDYRDIKAFIDKLRAYSGIVEKYQNQGIDIIGKKLKKAAHDAYDTMDDAYSAIQDIVPQNIRVVGDPMIKLRGRFNPFFNLRKNKRDGSLQASVKAACEANDPADILDLASGRLFAGCAAAQAKDELLDETELLLEKAELSQWTDLEPRRSLRCRMENIMIANAFTADGTRRLMQLVTSFVTTQSFAMAVCMGAGAWGKNMSEARYQQFHQGFDRTTSFLSQNVVEMFNEGAKKFSSDNVHAAVTDFISTINAYKASFFDENGFIEVDYLTTHLEQPTHDLLEAMDNTSVLLPRLLYESVEEDAALSKALHALNAALAENVTGFSNEGLAYLRSLFETDTSTQWNRVVLDPQIRLLSSIKNLLDPSISQRTNTFRDVVVADCRTNDPVAVFSIALDLLTDGCNKQRKWHGYDDLKWPSKKEKTETCRPFRLMEKNAYSWEAALTFLRFLSDLTVKQIFATTVCFGAKAWSKENDAKHHYFKQIVNSSVTFMSTDFLEDYTDGTKRYKRNMVSGNFTDIMRHFLHALSDYDQIFTPTSTVFKVIADNRTRKALTTIRNATATVLQIFPAIFNEDRFMSFGVDDAAVVLRRFAREQVERLNDDIEQHLSWIESTNPIPDWNQAVRDPVVRLNYAIKTYLNRVVKEELDVSADYVAEARYAVEACRANDPGSVFAVAWDRIAGGCLTQKSTGESEQKYAPKRCRVEQIMDANTYTTNGTMLVMRFIADVVLLQTFTSTFCLGMRSWASETAVRTIAHDDIADQSTDMLERQIPEYASRYFTTSGHARKVIADEAAMSIESTNATVRYIQMDNATSAVKGRLDESYRDWQHGVWWWPGSALMRFFSVGGDVPAWICEDDPDVPYTIAQEPFAVETTSHEKYEIFLTRVAGTKESAQECLHDAVRLFGSPDLAGYVTGFGARLCGSPNAKDFNPVAMNGLLKELLQETLVFNTVVTVLLPGEASNAKNSIGGSASADVLGVIHMATCNADPKNPLTLATIFTI